MPGSLTFHLCFKNGLLWRFFFQRKLSFVLEIMPFAVLETPQCWVFQLQWQTSGCSWALLVFQHGCQRVQAFPTSKCKCFWKLAAFLVLWHRRDLRHLIAMWSFFYLARSVLYTSLLRSLFSGVFCKRDFGLSETSWMNKAELNRQLHL